MGQYYFANFAASFAASFACFNRSAISIPQ